MKITPEEAGDLELPFQCPECNREWKLSKTAMESVDFPMECPSCQGIMADDIQDESLILVGGESQPLYD